ncbi:MULTISPECIES: tyrosine-type recombinase/integrase [Calothrix]|uniref:Site-specific integrase n=2 Tax=Calothrix TaxID=1186 RepID=A0ABR8AKS4_9CYAN|nr:MULTISPECIES: site-specific integrase [Calothrix]MBD2200389.1 site-specific integrase [Calothrix parietina FACHB-288]MBD2229372.1 site-specific integrase [Calothrix anomala FACHB-343]
MMESAESLPPIKLIPIEDAALNREPVGSNWTTLTTPPTDIRWVKVLEFLRSNNLAPNSRKLYSRELKRFLGWTQLHYHELRPRHFGLYKEYLRDEVKTDTGKSLSKSSINAGLAAIKSFFKWMCFTYPEIITTNPTQGVKLEKVPLPPAQSLTPEQMERVWSALEFLGETKQRDTALVHILSHGLRAGEIVQLNVGSFDGKLLFLPDTKTNEPRLVPLRSQSREVLAEYLRSRSQQGEELNSQSPLMISHHASYKGDRLSYHGIYFAVEKIGELAGIEDLHPHQFRHTYATDLLLLGVDPTHARKLTGHQSEKAFRRYTLRSEQEAAIAAYYRAIGEDQEEY